MHVGRRYFVRTTAGIFGRDPRSADRMRRAGAFRRVQSSREDQRVSMHGVHKGEVIEVVADRDANAGMHYARTVHVIEASRTPRPAIASGRDRRYRFSPIDFLAPRGNLTFAGVVLRLSDDSLVLRTRQEGEKIILLRLDTRYLEGGVMVDAMDLKPNTRVFVRAGANLDDQVEAYQVVWGEILEPARSR
jgi:hypothetical protein